MQTFPGNAFGCFFHPNIRVFIYFLLLFIFIFYFFLILSVQMVTKMSLNTLGFGNSRQTCQCLHCMSLSNWCRHVRSQFTISMNSCFLVLVLKLETKESSFIEAYKSNLEGRPSKWKGNLSHSLTGFRFCCCCYNLSILISTYWKPKPLKKNYVDMFRMQFIALISSVLKSHAVVFCGL